MPGLQVRLRRLDDQLAVVRARSLGMAASPFGPSRAATPPTEVPRLSRPPAVWPTYAEGGFPMTGDRRGADSVMPMAAKRKASFERVRNVEPKRQRSVADGKWENRLVPNGRMRNAFQHCSKLLDTLMRDRGSKAYFNAPVDPDALGTPSPRVSYSLMLIVSAEIYRSECIFLCREARGAVAANARS
jgi:hypothetical protein